MKAAFTTLTLAAGASAAAVLPRDAGCCFGLTASGGVSGSVSQLSDGQNRVGGSSSTATPAKYCLNNGGITDGNGRGCILTPPTTQFQCDMGASPTTGFSVSGSGNVAYNGNTQFVACPVNDNGEYNIYTTAPEGQGGCKSITLSTGGACSGNGASSSASASSASASSAPASSAPASSAPASSAPASSAPSAPASSAPASSAPASSAPASSAPASSAPSAPASSAPASSAPASSAPSAPASSAPAPSASAPQPSVSMVTSCTTYAVTHYAPAPSAPASQSAPASSAPASSAPATTAAPSAQPSYACNPAHSYPNGAQCVSSGTGLTLVTPAPSAPASSVYASSSAPAPSAPASSAKASSSAPAPSAPASQSAPAPSAPAASSSSAATKASASASGSACATTLQSGAYQTPHLIVPVNKDSPSTSYGTQYNADINQKNSTIFQFDIPQSYAGKQCSLVFLWPEQSQLETSSFKTSGSGDLTFGQCSAQTSESTTYESAGDCKTVGSVHNAAPGNSYVVASGPCAAGQSVSYEASASGSLSLNFFEDWNPSPIGAFITSC